MHILSHPSQVPANAAAFGFLFYAVQSVVIRGVHGSTIRNRSVDISSSTKQGAYDWPNVDGFYFSVYSSLSDCPRIVSITGSRLVSDRPLSFTQHFQIVEDGIPCNDANFTGYMYTEDLQYFNSPLAEKSRTAGPRSINQRLKENTMGARSHLLSLQFDDSRIGYDVWTQEAPENVRRCGRHVYKDNTFWFHINGNNTGKNIRIVDSKSSTVVVIPRFAKGLYVLADGRRCMLSTRPRSSGGTTSSPTTTTLARTTKKIQRPPPKESPHPLPSTQAPTSTTLGTTRLSIATTTTTATPRTTERVSTTPPVQSTRLESSESTVVDTTQPSSNGTVAAVTSVSDSTAAYTNTQTSAGVSSARPLLITEPSSGEVATTGQSATKATTDIASTIGTTATDYTTSTTFSSTRSLTSTTLTQQSSDSDGSACFPGDATVELENGEVVALSRLAIGARVRVSPHEFSSIFAFTHRLASTRHTFVEARICESRSAVLRATSGHYVHTSGGTVPLGRVTAGDKLALGTGAWGMVCSVRRVQATGLYNPQTLHGDVVVNGVVASTYTTAVAPPIAHASLAPLRWAFQGFGLYTTLLESGNDVAERMIPFRGSAP